MISVALVSFYVMVVGALPAVAAEAEADAHADATHDVVAMKTQHEWFYWPGWAFLALALLVIGLVVFFWVKTLIMPKYRGRKVTS